MNKRQKNKMQLDQTENRRKQAYPVETEQDTASTPELDMENEDKS